MPHCHDPHHIPGPRRPAPDVVDSPPDETDASYPRRPGDDGHSPRHEGTDGPSGAPQPPAQHPGDAGPVTTARPAPFPRRHADSPPDAPGEAQVTGRGAGHRRGSSTSARNG